MSCLLVDVGNTRVKWATSNGEQLTPGRSAAYAEWSADDWRRALLGERGFERVLVASVARGEAVDRLRTAVRVATGREAEFVASTPEAAGVRNAYRDPAQLGVDRWLAIVAAHRDPGGACCVVDVGTAATIDAVRGDGQHLGGFIVPGPDLMVGSLLRGLAVVNTYSGTPGGTAGSDSHSKQAGETGH